MSAAAGIIDLGAFELSLSFGLILMAMGLSRLQGAGQGRSLCLSAARMGVQLFAMGYALHLVFALRHALPVLLLLLLMLGLSVQTIAARVRHKMPGFYRIVGLSMILGCGALTLIFCQLVIGLDPWYDPRYLIPLGGMIIGNAMTGASLAAERLSEEIRSRRDEIETALCLGATVREAANPAIRSAFRAALIPSINAMAAMGIVFLPGMMTGQILSGTDPLIAVKYQMAIMCVITGSVALTSSLILWQGLRGYFTPAHQLRTEVLDQQ